MMFPRKSWRAVLGAVLTMVLPMFAQTPKDQSWKILQDGSKNQDQHQRAVAIRALGLVPGDSAAEALAVQALSDPTIEVRVSAAGALGQMDAKGSIPALKEALKDKDVAVILAAASSLNRLEDPSRLRKNDGTT